MTPLSVSFTLSTSQQISSFLSPPPLLICPVLCVPSAPYKNNFSICHSYSFYISTNFLFSFSSSSLDMSFFCVYLQLPTKITTLSLLLFLHSYLFPLLLSSYHFLLFPPNPWKSNNSDNQQFIQQVSEIYVCVFKITSFFPFFLFHVILFIAVIMYNINGLILGICPGWFEYSICHECYS